jgi:hypothetical protein
VAAGSGIDFVHTSGMTGAKHVPTANGSGAALFDFDRDGRLDLYFATGTFLPVGSRPTGPNRLYRNLGEGTFRFRDATGASGLGFAGYCHGALAGDIDNDGDQDIFLCNYGPNALFLNNGDGTFRDISRSAGVDRPSWTSSGAFLDYDRDGDLDLYLANYGDWKLPADDIFCGNQPKGVRVYCHPKWIRTAKHILFRNNGDHTFTDVTDAAGVGRTDGHGFGVVAADLDDDGLIDLYVANDKDPNFLFLNRGDGTFEDVTLTSGAGLSEQGQAYAGMGVDAEDVDGDGLPELFVTNFAGEPNTLYQNLGGGSFLDVTTLRGLAVDSIPWVGWGCALADFDNDGWPDCFVANGHIDDNRHLLGEDSPYAQPPLLYRNEQGRGFRAVGLAPRPVEPGRLREQAAAAVKARRYEEAAAALARLPSKRALDWILQSQAELGRGRPCFAAVEMGQTICSNKLQLRAEVLPCPRRPESASRLRRKPPSCRSISSNTPRSRTSVTSTASTPRCSTAGRRSSSRTPRRPSSPAPDGPATPRIGGSPSWSRSSSARTKSSLNSWRNISN